MPSRPSDPTSLEEIGRRLALTRKALGYTQVMMGRLMGAAGGSQAWENYEACRRRISIDHAIKLAQSCGVPLDWVYQGQTLNLPSELREKILRLMREDNGNAPQLPTGRKSARR